MAGWVDGWADGGRKKERKEKKERGKEGGGKRKNFLFGGRENSNAVSCCCGLCICFGLRQVNMAV